jgi:hypothetical protein
MSREVEPPQKSPLEDDCLRRLRRRELLPGRRLPPFDLLFWEDSLPDEMVEALRGGDGGPHSLLRRGTDGCCEGDGVGDGDLAGLAPRLNFLRFPLGGFIAVVGYAPTQRRTP